MRALIQRTTQASVSIDGQLVSSIDQGMVIFMCAMQGDSNKDCEKLARKISKLRIFKDETGRMNKSIVDCLGSCLIVSQFTLAADTKRGNRPGFSQAADPKLGRELYHLFCEEIRKINIQVEEGVFGADMDVSILNQGPVTIWIDTKEN